VKIPAPVPVSPLQVTVTSAGPADPAGVVTAMVVDVITPTLALVPSTFAVHPLANPVPVIVAEVPPVVVPALGLIDVTTGGVPNV